MKRFRLGEKQAIIAFRVILSILLLKQPDWLFLPTTLLFTSKFLFAPLLNKLVFRHSCSTNMGGEHL